MYEYRQPRDDAGSATAPSAGPDRAREPRPVLLLGGTGRTGSRVLLELLDRAIPVRAVVRPGSRLPDGAVGHPLLTVAEGEVRTMTDDSLGALVDGVGAVVSCLGHRTSVRGVLGPPWRLVEQSVARVCDAVAAQRPATPVRLVLMSSVSVNRPARADTRRGRGERIALSVLRALVPPARDNQRAADLLVRRMGPDQPYVEWVVVRPDTLRDGDTSAYRLSDELTASLRRPDETAMANIADFMAELLCDNGTWERWAGRMPVITNTPG